MIIKVLCDDEEVYNGDVEGFLKINEYEESLVEIVGELKAKEQVEFKEVSGHWIITRE